MPIPYTTVEEAISLPGLRMVVVGRIPSPWSEAAKGMLLRPLPHEVCAMDATTRTAFEYREPATDAALDEVLLVHRDMMYRRHLAFPLSL